jgi:hypothetical protein
MNIKSLDAIASKYAEVTPGRAAFYQAGVLNPKADWETNTKAAAGNYASGVQAGIAKGSFAKGVSAAGTGKWQKKTSTVGVDRWGAGVSAGADDYKTGFSKYHGVLSSLKTSARKETGNPANYQIVAEIGNALHKAKVGS